MNILFYMLSVYYVKNTKEHELFCSEHIVFEMFVALEGLWKVIFFILVYVRKSRMSIVKR